MDSTAKSVEILKAFIRSNAPGKCKLFTEATTVVECECELCCVDHLFAEACKNAKLVKAAREYVTAMSDDEQRKPFCRNYKFEFGFKNGKAKIIITQLEREQADHIADLIYGSFQGLGGVLKIPQNKSIIHFIKLSEVESVVIYEVKNE